MDETTKINIVIYCSECPDSGYCIHEVANEEEALKKVPTDESCYGYELLRSYKSVVFGKVYTLEDIKRMVANGEPLENILSYMRRHNLDKIVKTRSGDWGDWKKGVEYISK
jgi:hypothetical protein